jgi:hypothetical protein
MLKTLLKVEFQFKIKLKKRVSFNALNLILIMKANFESFNLSKFKKSEVSNNRLYSITGGRTYTEGGKQVDANGNGFAWESDHVDGGITTYNRDGFKCIQGGKVVQC